MSAIENKLKELGITVTALAKRVGVSRQQIYNWINKKAQPNANQIMSLSKILGLSITVITKDFINKEEN